MIPRCFVLLAILISSLLAFTGCNKAPAPAQEASASATVPAPIDPAMSASISGVVNFGGTPPPAQSIDMSADSGCKGQNQSETVVVKNGRLANVLIYVKEGLGAHKFSAPLEKVVIDQKGCRFVPHVAAAMVGQPVEFLNSDDALHNIHPMPKSNSEWNQSQMPNGQFARPFTAAELMIPVKCNQHPWMRMYLNIVDNPYFAVTGADGSFILKGLPPGTYTIAAVQEKFGEKDTQISVGPKDDRRGVDFEFRP